MVRANDLFGEDQSTQGDVSDSLSPSGESEEHRPELITFDAATSQRNAARRQEEWLDTLNAARLWPVRVGLVLGCVALLAVFAWVLYVVVFATVHFTVPQWKWASIEDLSWVKPVYSTFTNASAPVFLGMNAWLIWLVSRNRR